MEDLHRVESIGIFPVRDINGDGKEDLVVETAHFIVFELPKGGTSSTDAVVYQPFLTPGSKSRFVPFDKQDSCKDNYSKGAYKDYMGTAWLFTRPRPFFYSDHNILSAKEWVLFEGKLHRISAFRVFAGSRGEDVAAGGVEVMLEGCLAVRPEQVMLATKSGERLDLKKAAELAKCALRGKGRCKKMESDTTAIERAVAAVYISALQTFPDKASIRDHWDRFLKEKKFLSNLAPSYCELAMEGLMRFL